FAAEGIHRKRALHDSPCRRDDDRVFGLFSEVIWGQQGGEWPDTAAQYSVPPGGAIIKQWCRLGEAMDVCIWQPDRKLLRNVIGTIYPSGDENHRAVPVLCQRRQCEGPRCSDNAQIVRRFTCLQAIQNVAISGAF